MKQDLYNNDWINIDGNSIHKTAIIHPNVKLGTGNTIGAYCVIGGNGEIRNVKQSDFHGTVHIGNNNVISEHVTIQRPKDRDKSTIICDNNIIMAHAHIGHDAYIGNNCEICTSSVIGGHVTVYDDVKIKLHCVIRNRLIISQKAVIGMGSVVTKNVPYEAVVYGNPAKEKEKTIEKDYIQEFNDLMNTDRECENEFIHSNPTIKVDKPVKKSGIFNFLMWASVFSFITSFVCAISSIFMSLTPIFYIGVASLILFVVFIYLALFLKK